MFGTGFEDAPRREYEGVGKLLAREPGINRMGRDRATDVKDRVLEAMKESTQIKIRQSLLL